MAILIFGQRPTPLRMEWKTGVCRKVLHISHILTPPNSLHPFTFVNLYLKSNLEKKDSVRIILILHIWEKFAEACRNERLSWFREIMKDERTI